MGRRYLAVIVFLLLFLPSMGIAAPSQARVAVFNFGTVNLEASGLGATVTNMLIGSLGGDRSLILLDRKELESFLGMNDLQQNDKMDNVLNIGSRLGLNVVVVGNVEKKGTVIMITCRAIQIEQKKTILNTRAGAMGEAALAGEITKLGEQIKKTISEQIVKDKGGEGASCPPPVKVRKRPGNRSIHLSWEEVPGAVVAGYEVFRATSESGPFSCIAQPTKPEYLDDTVEKGINYYYKIRAYNEKGLQSEFTPTIDARTAVTPNAPVILKAEGHIKGMALLWSPGPRSEDPLSLKGYRLYRAQSEQGPYREIVNIQSQSLGGVTEALDRLLKVPYLDKGLADGEDYYYRVTAYNEKELESGYSSAVKGTTTPSIGAVTALGALIREIRLSWLPLASPFIKGYKIYRSPADQEKFVLLKRVDVPMGSSARKVEYADREDLGDQTGYQYRVTAVEDNDVESSPSPVVSAVTRGKPPQPEEFKAVSGQVKKVELSWKASAAEDVEGYKLYASRTKEGEYPFLKSLSGRATNRYTDDSRGFDKLEDGAAYFYKMTTYNRVGVESDATAAAAATTKPRPSKPSGLTGESNKAKTVPLTWSANPEKDIVAYHIYRSAGAGSAEFERISKAKGTTYVDQGLKDNTSYRYRLQAEDNDGLLGEFSDVFSTQTKARPSRPGESSGQVKDGKVLLTWKAGAEGDIDHYTVYEKRLFGTEKIGTTREASFSEDAPAKAKTKTYVITATDGDGLESDTTAELSVTGP